MKSGERHKRYFTHLGRTNNPTNALQREAGTVLEDASNRLVDDLNAFLADLKSKIESLNAAYPRCEALHFSTYGISSTSTGVYLGGRFTVDFNIYRVKEAS